MEETRRLIKACLRNEREAQRCLYEQYAGVMLGLCFRYTKSMPDAEDILQDGFIAVFRNLEQYRFDGELGAWIRRIMVNTALNFLKKNARYRAGMVFDKSDVHPVSDENPEIALDTKQLASLVQQLPTGYQTIFNLYAIEGFSHVEIGQMLGITDGTSRSQYARARSLMISWITKDYSGNKMSNYATK